MLKQMKLNKTPKEYGNVAVLLGGHSAEREVSLASGECIFNALVKNKISVVKIDPIDGLYESLIKHKIDRVFIALHGRDGEDGVVQGFLKMLNIPYTGSDVASAAVSMNKLLSKQIWQQLNIKTADYSVVKVGQEFTLGQAQHLITTMGSPLFVKPVREGSSVGMSKVNIATELMDAIALSHQFDDALIESFIAGKEYTVTILNGAALPSISMQTPREFYDYKAKYQVSTTEYFCPSGLNESDENEVKQLALRAFSSLGCSGWGRVDFIRDNKSNDFIILEANTVPGMTETSLVPKSAKAIGLSFDDLVMNILNTSFTE